VATDVKRVCLLGAESTGKTTLAAALAERFGTAWNPEYGRPYTQIGRRADAPWTSWEFTHIARIQCWYEDFLAALAERVCSPTPTRSRPRSSTRSTWERLRQGSTSSCSVGTTSSSCAVSMPRGATTASGSSNRNDSGCTSATSVGCRRAEARGCSSKGRSRSALAAAAAAVEQVLADG
jgi:hypothetical protein